MTLKSLNCLSFLQKVRGYFVLRFGPIIMVTLSAGNSFLLYFREQVLSRKYKSYSIMRWILKWLNPSLTDITVSGVEEFLNGHDRLEGEGSLYLRKQVEVLVNGQIVQGWAYMYMNA